MSKSKTHENPLVPHKKLRQMFTAMTEMRVLDEHISGLQRKVGKEKRLRSTHGEEAARVSTAIELEEGDLVSDSDTGVAMELLAGVKVSSLLRQVEDFLPKKKGSKTSSAKAVGSKRQMSWMEDTEDCLMMALGAALSFKTLKRTNLVIAYVHKGQASNGAWKHVLGVAAKFTLPVIFVVLPGDEVSRKGSAKTRELSAKARAYGVPGIPVDAHDAVALYRVAQESIGRVRAGGGPVLMECVAWHAAGKGAKKNANDPLARMREFLTGREVASAVWLDGAGDKLRKRLSEVKSGKS